MESIRDKIAKARELREKAECPCIGLCYVKSHWNSVQDFNDFSQDNILDLCDALEKCLDHINEGHINAINYQKTQGHLHDPEWCHVCKLLQDLEPSEELTKERE